MKDSNRMSLVAIIALSGLVGACGGEKGWPLVGMTNHALQEDTYLDIGTVIRPFQFKNRGSGKCARYDSGAGYLVESTCATEDPGDDELWEAKVLARDPSGSYYNYTYRLKNVYTGTCLYRASNNSYGLGTCSDNDTAFKFNVSAEHSLWWDFTQLTTDGHCIVSNNAGNPPPQFVGESFSGSPPACVVNTLNDYKEWFRTRIVGCDWGDPSCDEHFD